jgi:hypothetical protein
MESADAGTKAAPQTATQAAARPSRGPIAFTVVALLVSTVALLALAGVSSRLGAVSTQVDGLKASVDKLESGQARLLRSADVLSNAVTLLSDEQIDLTNGKLQHLRHGFAVSELHLARQDSGVVVSGRLINTSSLRYRGAIFRLKVGASAKEFPIDTLAPGSSGEFEVELQHLPLENARTATLSLVTGGVDYQR